MFKIKKHKIILNDLSVIADNYQEIFAFENPVLYYGSNKYDNKILGAIIGENEENNTLWYFHLVLDDASFFDFLKKKKALLELMRETPIIFVVEKTFLGEVIETNLISIEDIPSDFLPLKDSFCPQISSSNSLTYSFSLKGRTSDMHKIEVHDNDKIQTSLRSILENACKSLYNLESKKKIYNLPAQAGSYKLNFQIDFANNQTELFNSDNTKISDYLNSYFDFIVSKLPEEVGLSSEKQIKSDTFLKIENQLSEIFKESHIELSTAQLQERLIDSFNTVAHEFEEVSTLMKESESFNKLEIANYSSPSKEVAIGLIDSTYSTNIKNKLLPEETIIEKTEKDKKPQPYRILIYVLNAEVGHGKARLYHGMEESFERISITIKLNGKDLHNTIYTKGFHEGKVIDVKAIGEKVDGKYRNLTIEL